MKPVFVPAILTDSEAELLRSCTRLAPLVSTIHIDFADNTLVPNTTILPDELDVLPTGVEFHAHLMTDRPSQYFGQLAGLGFTTVVVHVEAAESMEEIVEQADAAHLKIAVAINPETVLDRLMIYKDHTAYVQVMGVHPGFGGQQFIEETYGRIAELHQRLPAVRLAVDGGVRLSNAQRLIAAGAELLIVGPGGYQDDGVERWHEYLKTVTQASK